MIAPTPDAYDRALALVREFGVLDGPEIAPVCTTTLLAHGAPTETAFLFLHGLTNCPAQFLALARACHARGANVFVPRLPRHGLADRMTDALAHSDAAELAAFADHAVDAARGLGQRLVVSGLSVGGTLAAWAGQTRREVAHCVPIAPLLALPHLPTWVSSALGRVLAVLPNAHVWWDRKRREGLLGPAHVYPRFATRGVAASLLLGARVLSRARREAPACARAAVVTVEGDRAVSNRAAGLLAQRWAAHGLPVATHRFDRETAPNHDVIDPAQVGARTELTVPILLHHLFAGS